MAMLCARCNQQVVHEKRDFNLCLDCLIEMLIKQGSLEIPKHFEASIFEEKMARKGKCHYCGEEKRKFRHFSFCQCERDSFGRPMMNEHGQLSIPAWNLMLSAEEIEELVYVHGTTAIEGNTLDIEDCFEILYGDVMTVIEKYEWDDMTVDKLKKILEESERSPDD